MICAMIKQSTKLNTSDFIKYVIALYIIFGTCWKMLIVNVGKIKLIHER